MSQWTTRSHELRKHQAQQLAHVVSTIDVPTIQRFILTAGGDNTRLRGIPAIGPGVTGAIPGTTPHNIR